MEAGTTTITAPQTRLLRKLERDGVITIEPELPSKDWMVPILEISDDFLR